MFMGGYDNLGLADFKSLFCCNVYNLSVFFTQELHGLLMFLTASKSQTLSSLHPYAGPHRNVVLNLITTSIMFFSL